MSPIIVLAALIISLLIMLGFLYLSFKLPPLGEEEEMDFKNEIDINQLLPLQIGYWEVRGWR